MDFRKLARLFVGVLAFLVILVTLQGARVMFFATEAAVEAGKVSATSALPISTFLEIGSAIFATLVFIFTRLGDGVIAFFAAVLQNQAAPVPPVVQIVQQPKTEEAGEVASGNLSEEDLATRAKVLELAQASKDGDRLRVVQLANELHGSEFLTLATVKAPRTSRRG